MKETTQQRNLRHSMYPHLAVERMRFRWSESERRRLRELWPDWKRFAEETGRNESSVKSQAQAMGLMKPETGKA